MWWSVSEKSPGYSRFSGPPYSYLLILSILTLPFYLRKASVFVAQSMVFSHFGSLWKHPENKSRPIAFTDFTKTFETVNCHLLFKLSKILSKSGCPPNLFKTIQHLYSEVKAILVIEGELSNPFNYDCSVMLPVVN